MSEATNETITVPNFTGQAPRAYLTVHAGEADAVEVARGQYVQVADTLGGQVALFTAFRQDYHEEYVSTSQTIGYNRNFMLQTGHVLVSNLGNPMLTLVEDTVGRHDLLLPADDARFYLNRGVNVAHTATRDALAIALSRYNIGYDRVPDPVNFFQHVGFGERGAWEFRPPLSERDDLVTLRAEMDLLIAVAASADDISERNNHSLSDIVVRVYFA